jgi:hypothetical protein
VICRSRSRRRRSPGKSEEIPRKSLEIREIPGNPRKSVEILRNEKKYREKGHSGGRNINGNYAGVMRELCGIAELHFL